MKKHKVDPDNLPDGEVLCRMEIKNRLEDGEVILDILNGFKIERRK